MLGIDENMSRCDNIFCNVCKNNYIMCAVSKCYVESLNSHQTHDEILSLQRIGSSPFVETLTFDSVWTLALALNRTMNMINTSDTLDCGPSPVPLEEFSYGNSSTACLIRNSLSATNFIGLSVRYRNLGNFHVHTYKQF